ncbi:MAG TPA: site-2 protease family protein [Tepidisphaeraceae bacterium]|jgi:Zn-dependent protease
MLGVIDFHNPLFWALLVGWLMTVFLHEFAHGLVAYLGGDYTIRQRGGLSMNPIHYVDPMMSLILPLLFFAMGGIPLPGGAIYIRRDLLRHRGWEIAVAAAGPAANLLIFFGLCFALSERVGWVDYTVPVARWPLEKIFVAALAFFQLFAVLINLLPIPPLDGFQMIGPLLPRDVEQKLLQPTLSIWLPGRLLLCDPGLVVHARVVRADAADHGFGRGGPFVPGNGGPDVAVWAAIKKRLAPGRCQPRAMGFRPGVLGCGWVGICGLS